MKCYTRDCSLEPVVRVMEVRNRAAVGEEHLFCESHAKAFWESYLCEKRNGVGFDFKMPNTSCFELDLIMGDQRSNTQKISLREVGNTRLVYFPVGFLEVCILWYAVLDSPYKEFGPHATMCRLIECMGGQLAYVIINDFNSEGFFDATATILRCEETVDLQIRPSDGLALAILANVPFLVAENALRRIAHRGDFGKC